MNAVLYSPSRIIAIFPVSKAFEAENPDIKIDIETHPGGSEGDNLVKTQLATAEMGDVFRYNAGSLFHALNPAQNLMDLTNEPFQANVFDSFKPVVSEGGKVYGVIPQALVDHEVAHTGLTELVTVANMHERKAKMTELCDGFVCLPGGIGTLDEMFEAWTWNALGYHAQPFCLLNVNGFWDGLADFMDHVRDSGFLSQPRRLQLLKAETPAEALDLLDEAAKNAEQGVTW